MDANLLVKAWIEQNDEQLAGLTQAQKRMFGLLACGMATQKQMDDAGAEFVRALKSSPTFFQRRMNLAGAITEKAQREDYVIPWVLSAQSADREGDVVNQHKWALANYEANNVVIWGHGRREDEPIAMGNNLRVEEGQKSADTVNRLVGDVKWAVKESDIAARKFRLAAAGFIKAGSVGFLPTNVPQLSDEEREARGVGPTGVYFDGQELLEFSIVSVPMHPGAVQAQLRDAANKGVIESGDADLLIAESDPTEREWDKWCRRKAREFVPMPEAPSNETDDAEPEETPVFSKTLSTAEAMLRTLEARNQVAPEQKTFDVENQHLEAAKLEYDWVSRFCSCEVKDLHELTTGVGRLYLGSLLTGLDHALAEYAQRDARNITDRGQEVPPSYERVQLTAESSGDFMVQGLRFMAGPCPLVVNVRRQWGGYKIGVYSKRSDVAHASKVLNDAHRWMSENNFLKGQAFSLSGEFVKGTDETWDSLFLDGDTKQVVQRAVRNMNEKGKDCPNRGGIWMGPPGTGKTLTGRVARNSMEGVTLIWCSARDFYYTGASGGIMQAFDVARDLAPAMVFLEDIDGYLHGAAYDLLKTEMDGMARSTGVFTVLTTNHPEQLPKALVDRPGRFHDVLEFGLPSAETRQTMFERWCPALSDEVQDQAVAESEGMSGAHVYELCEYAKTLSEQEGIEKSPAMLMAIDKVKAQRQAADFRPEKGMPPLGDMPCRYDEAKATGGLLPEARGVAEWRRSPSVSEPGTITVTSTTAEGLQTLSRPTDDRIADALESAANGHRTLAKAITDLTTHLAGEHPTRQAPVAAVESANGDAQENGLDEKTAAELVATIAKSRALLARFGVTSSNKES